MGKVSKPFTMSKGGYMVTLNPRTGQVKNVFGSVEAEQMHAGRQDPHPAARSARKSVEKTPVEEAVVPAEDPDKKV